MPTRIFPVASYLEYCRGKVPPMIIKSVMATFLCLTVTTSGVLLSPGNAVLLVGRPARLFIYVSSLLIRATLTGFVAALCGIVGYDFIAWRASSWRKAVVRHTIHLQSIHAFWDSRPCLIVARRLSENVNSHFNLCKRRSRSARLPPYFLCFESMRLYHWGWALKPASNLSG